MEHILKETFKNLLFPFTDNLYNLRLDPYDCSSFTLFASQSPIPTSIPHANLSIKYEFFVPVAELLPYIFLITALISCKKGLLVLAPAGSCKTSLISHIIDALSAETQSNYQETQENELFSCEKALYFPAFSACPPSSLQTFLEKSLRKKNKSTYGAAAGKTAVFFIDDVNLLEKESRFRGLGAEFLRQLLENCGFYDFHRLEWRNIQDLALIASYSAGDREISQLFSQRFASRLQKIHVQFPNNSYIKSVFAAFLNDFFLLQPGFGQEAKFLQEQLFSATFELFRKLQQLFKPSPRKFCNEFSLKDLKNLAFGLLSLRNGNAFSNTRRETLAKAWVHEVFRVFCDRFAEEDDREKFAELVKSLSQQFLQLPIDFSLENLCFSDFPRVLLSQGVAQNFAEEVKDLRKLQQNIAEKLEERGMRFALSEEIAVFLLRALRILRFPGLFPKHLLVLGLAGSGFRDFLINIY